MPATDYVKAEVTAFGKAIGNLIDAVTEDGVGAEDLGALLIAVNDGAKTVNEFKDVPAAAGLHALGAAGDTFGDHLLQKAIDAEAAAEGGG